MVKDGAQFLLDDVGRAILSLVVDGKYGLRFLLLGLGDYV